MSSPRVPAVRAIHWPRNPIDHFIGERLENASLTPSPEADRRTLIRRLSFDLLGLPSNPGEIDAFLNDSSPDAYERLADRYLASPHFGEKWARHWLDLARYTESQGFEYDHMRPNAWHYRDYVIASFNHDKPYDRFVKEQIAGDVLEPVTPEGIIATSLLVCGSWDQAGNNQANAAQKALTREEELEDLISVVGQTFLGLTVNCARCHDHKFDPIPQTDYYRFKAVFEGVRHGERPIVGSAEGRNHAERVARLRARMAAVEREVQQPEMSGFFLTTAELEAALTNAERQKRKELHRQIAEDRAALKSIPPLPVSYAGLRKEPEPTRLLRRGDVKSPADVVTPGALSAVGQPAPDFVLAANAPEAERRRMLAEWIADSRHPLTARVIVNRLWQHHFGVGLVSTPNDFGASGARPSHPELLDWLAGRLIAHDWSLKAVHRLIIGSATYRQASAFRTDAAESDAENQRLWRYSPRRLDAEALRDAMLLASGELNASQGGPSFRPFETKNFNATFYFPTDKIGPEFARRTIYRMNVNSGKDPLLDAFDCPDPANKSPRRNVTTTPLQALGLMNNAFVQRHAALLAERVLRESEGNRAAAVGRAYRYALGRWPTDEELALAEKAVRETSVASVCWALFNATEFLYVQ